MLSSLATSLLNSPKVQLRSAATPTANVAEGHTTPTIHHVQLFLDIPSLLLLRID